MKKWNRLQNAEKCAMTTQKFYVRSYPLHGPLERQFCRYQKQGFQQDRRILRAPPVLDLGRKPSLESEALIRH